MMEDELAAFSAHRLGGEPAPDDLQMLLAHAEELSERTGFELRGAEGSAPWLDTSYLTPADRANPEIMANVRAIADVCDCIAFVAVHEDPEYLGYWRGPDKRSIAGAPLVILDNEGLFSVCGSTFAEALLSRTLDEEQFAELRGWLRSLGVGPLPESLDDLSSPQADPSPEDWHEARYRAQFASPADGLDP